jgi:2-polyprenyl-3-methyl-5-hydroxy-6-metoxy-1,4-benzoquinol methylase
MQDAGRIGTDPADIETASDDYARRFAGPVGAWFLDVQERAVVSMLDPGASPLLDVGGGHGQLAVPLCRRGFEVTVTGSAESCRRRIAEAVDGGRCRFQVANVLSLPFPDRSFHTVLCFRLVTHCEQWPALIQELCRVAAKAVIIDYPTSESLNRVSPALFSAKRKIERNTRRWRLFTHAEIEREFERGGFAPARREGQFFLPMVLHRALRCRTVSRFLEGACRSLGLVGRFGSPVIVKMTRR